MKAKIPLLILSMLMTLAYQGQTMLELLTEELASFDMIMDDTMYAGEGGVGEAYTPEVFQVYSNFLEAATAKDLILLMSHESPIVACYSYRGLLDQGYSPVLPILKNHKDRVKTVEWVSDDIVETQTCYLWMLQRTESQMKYKGLILNSEQTAEFQKMLDLEFEASRNR